MTPEAKKAKELVNKFQSISGHERFSIAYALIAVDELIKEQTMWQNGQVNPVKFWQAVKKELLKL